MVEHLGVAEELGHLDEEAADQPCVLLRVGLESLGVIGQGGMPGRAHPAAEPADDRGRLVRAKSIPLRSRIRSSSASKSRPSRPAGAAPPAASRSCRSLAQRVEIGRRVDERRRDRPGIDGNSAVAGFSMTTAPPACLTCHAPAEPSVPLPVRITAVRPGPYAAAAVSSRRSTDGATLPGRAGRRRSLS